MPPFRGTFDYTLDAKHRLTVPSNFRDSFPDGVVLSLGTQRCMTIWAPADFGAFVDDQLANVPPTSEEADDLDRFFQANAFDAGLDKAGRIGLPQKLLQRTGITKDVTVVGTRRCLEVWDRATWIAYDEGLDIRRIRADLTRGATS